MVYIDAWQTHNIKDTREEKRTLHECDRFTFQSSESIFICSQNNFSENAVITNYDGEKICIRGDLYPSFRT